MRCITTLLIIASSSFVFAQEVAFTIPEKDLIPEGITFDPTTGDFYLSSIFKDKVVKVSKGKTTDLFSAGHEGFQGGVGLHVDHKRRILWTCSGNIMGNKFRRAIHAFDLNTMKVLKKVVHPIDTVKRFYNDLVIADDGSVFITDTFDNSLWKWSLDMESPDEKNIGPVKLSLDAVVEFPNGIAITPDNEYLIVATARGLKRVNINTNHVELLAKPEGSLSSAGLDGIEYYKGSIVAVQNGYNKNSEMKLVRYFLSKDHDKIEKVVVLDTGNKYFNVPTTLTIVNDEVFVIANSQLDNLDQEKMKIKAPEKLTETFVIRYKLAD
jgi:WD40 repeat protein